MHELISVNIDNIQFNTFAARGRNSSFRAVTTSNRRRYSTHADRADRKTYCCFMRAPIRTLRLALLQFLGSLRHLDGATAGRRLSH